jgi:hypothetical protein
MILTDAKVRAHAEFEQALIDTGLTPADVREIEAAHPEVRRAGYRVPHGSFAGTAADYVHHLAQLAKGEVPVAAPTGSLAAEAAATRH